MQRLIHTPPLTPPRKGEGIFWAAAARTCTKRTERVRSGVYAAQCGILEWVAARSFDILKKEATPETRFLLRPRRLSVVTYARRDCRAFPHPQWNRQSGFAFGVAVIPVVSLFTPG